MPNRLRDYERLLELAQAHEYESFTLSQFASSERLPPRVLLLRHDIDSDVARAVRMWEVEQRLGVGGTYFFRLSTWDDGLIREIASGGGEVGYHYEELASVAKKHGATTRERALRLVDEARDLLRQNLVGLRRRSGLPLDVLASHGDFANRLTGVKNTELLTDASFRLELGIRLEAYDPIITSRVCSRSSDREFPQLWRPSDPAEALRAESPVVEILIHPRAWGASPRENLRQDACRIVEGGLLCARSWRSNW